MSDKSSAIARFERLRGEISFLLERPRLGEDFQRWHRDVLIALEETFGPDEQAEFQRIAFDVDPMLLRQLRKQRGTTLSDNYPDPYEIAQDDYYQKRLYDAEEFLLAMIILLRQ
jgi:hypothetical protein